MEPAGDVLAAGGIGGRPAAARDQRLAAAVAEVVEDVQRRAIAGAEMLGDAGGGPAGVGQQDHLEGYNRKSCTGV